MDKLLITGKKNLKGDINVHGSKNAALPILVSSLFVWMGNVEDGKVSVKASDYEKRTWPETGFGKIWKEVEDLILEYGKTEAEKVEVTIVAAGALYGDGECSYFEDYHYHRFKF